jgi:hypothetical protein
MALTRRKHFDDQSMVPEGLFRLGYVRLRVAISACPVGTTDNQS